ncbi:MAG: hypothetical protein JWL81_2443 [Verrucomicrobiales bacterium]|nr:hypothetical protein [Verrucomicrobiales bacterium]
MSFSAPPPDKESATTRWLRGQPPAVLAVWAMTAAFVAYGCMYAFRKPFTAAAFAGSFGGMDYKSLLVLSQLAGYTVSKFLGIKIVSEATAGRRVAMVLGLIGIAEAALVLFALTPAPWNVVFLFMNGLPLGMVWGLIFAFLEGRRVTEFMALGLSLSLIFASGWTKAAGLWVMHGWHVGEAWMPAVTGAMFLPLLLVSLRMLALLPPPDAADIAARSQRLPMDKAARHAFLRRHWPGLTLLILGYMLLSTYRDVRDTFQVDILRELGAPAGARELVMIETAVGVSVIAVLGLFVLIRSNRGAFIACGIVIAIGGVVAGLSTGLLQHGKISAGLWMTLTGIGLYAAFIPYQAILFERLLAHLRTAGTAAFLISLCDSFGYLSAVGLYTHQAFGGGRAGWAPLLTAGGYLLAILLPLFMLGALSLLAGKRHASLTEPGSVPSIVPEPPVL